MPDQNLPNQPPTAFPSVPDTPPDFPQPPTVSVNNTINESAPNLSPEPGTPQPENPMSTPNIPPVITNPIPPKGRGKIIATILGIFLLVGAVGAGVILVGQKQLFQQKAAGTIFTCTQEDIGSDCENLPSNETWSDGSCVFATCPYGDTNGDTACSYGDTGLTLQYGNCFTDIPGFISQLPKQGNCYQYDTIVSSSNHFWCKLTIPCNGWADNLDTCVPLSTATPTPLPTSTPFGCNSTDCHPGQVPDGCASGLFCYQWSAYEWACRDADCPTETDCTCDDLPRYTPTPTPTRTPTPTPTRPPGTTPTPTPAARTAPPSPTPTTPPSCPIAPQCYGVKAYDTNWIPLSATQLSALKAGNKVRFTVSASTSPVIQSVDIDKARFTINNLRTGEITDKKPGTEEFYYEYTIPSGVTSFTVGGELHSITWGWF